MGKNKKVTKKDTESDTDTDTDTENNKNIINSKVDKAKKTKIYIFLAIVLLAFAAFMWYRRNSKTQLLDNSQLAQTQGVQQMSQMPSVSQMQQMPSMSQIPQMQMGGMQQRLNPIQEIQLTQQMH